MVPTLYIIATPIGTASDLSPRARDLLETVGFVVCEDTRHTQKLLNHLKITAKGFRSLHEHNEESVSSKLIHELQSSAPYTAAIVTDAGTPCISDPGARLVAWAHKSGVRVCSVPGPSALPTALAASGFLQPRSIFSQFLSRNKEEQNEEFLRWQAVAPCIAVFYESPQRIQKTLLNLQSHFGEELEVCVSRELSKMFEEHMKGPLSSVIERMNTHDDIRGEFAVTVNVSHELLKESTHQKRKLSLEDAIENLLQQNELKLSKEVIKEFAQQNGLSAKDLYNAIQKQKP